MYRPEVGLPEFWRIGGMWLISHRLIRIEMTSVQKRRPDLVLYIHGKGGRAAESEHYKPLFPNWEVIGVDYRSDTPWEAGRLLNMAVEDLRAKGVSPVYLLTDHVGFYERYGWEFLCMVQGDGEPYLSRMYIHY